MFLDFFCVCSSTYYLLTYIFTKKEKKYFISNLIHIVEALLSLGLDSLCDPIFIYFSSFIIIKLTNKQNDY